MIDLSKHARNIFTFLFVVIGIILWYLYHENVTVIYSNLHYFEDYYGSKTIILFLVLLTLINA